MKHYRIFGNSLKTGLRNVGYSDVLMELIGILVHYLAMSPYASHIKEVVKELVNLNNSTDMDWLNSMLQSNDVDGGNITCGYFNGTNHNYNLCVAEISMGSAGILIHVVELVLVLIVLKCGNQREPKKCQLWVRMTVILTALESLIVVGSLFVKLQPKLIAHLIANIIYKVYSCGLVSAYVTETKEYSDLPGNSEPTSGTSETRSTEHPRND